MIVADTDVLIDALRGREPSRSRIALCIESRSLGTTSITAFELLAGAGSAKERERVEAVLGSCLILPLDESTSREAAAVHRELASNGKGIGTADSLIAGICRHRSLPLLTRNRGHFERVSGLRLADLG
jgi:predicted nucleic acid-binding protein